MKRLISVYNAIKCSINPLIGTSQSSTQVDCCNNKGEPIKPLSVSKLLFYVDDDLQILGNITAIFMLFSFDNEIIPFFVRIWLASGGILVYLFWLDQSNRITGVPRANKKSTNRNRSLLKIPEFVPLSHCDVVIFDAKIELSDDDRFKASSVDTFHFHDVSFHFIISYGSQRFVCLY
jgi:hypothetical protein